nr:PP0621 family protein [uncultured Rhodoferax sp.]
MKYLVLLLIALVVLWRLRSKHREPRHVHAPVPADAAPGAVEMQACSHCGLHMPATEMIAGARGRYCNEQHRELTEH